MKIMIMTDMEGCAGIVNFKDWVEFDGKYYEQGKVLLTEEINACIRGFYDAAGDQIERVFVVDGHGYGGINPLLLDERAEYSRGWGKLHLFGFDEGFDVVAVIGQHAKAGSVKSHLTHTGMPIRIDVKINGISVGEYGETVFKAGFFGAKVILASGERALCEEAKELTPWVYTAETKYGVTEDNGRDLCDEDYWVHNLGAVHVHPNVARRRIYEAAKASMEDYMQDPDKFKTLCPEPPFVYEEWLRKAGGRPAVKNIMRHDTDIIDMFSAPVESIPEGMYELPY